MRTSNAAPQTTAGHGVTEPAALVIMEESSVWSPLGAAQGASTTVVLKEEAHESHAELVRRTQSRARVLQRGGAAVGVAIMCCNNDTGVSAFERRSAVAQALLENGLSEHGGRLELVARPDAPGRARQALLALAGTLTGMLVGTSASIVVRLTDTAGSRRRTGTGGLERRTAA